MSNCLQQIINIFILFKKRTIFLKYSIYVILTLIIISAGMIMAASSETVIVLKVTPGDNTPPAAITNLSALVPTSTGTITITWTAPGNNASSGTLGTDSRFHIATTTILSDAQNTAYWNGRGTNTLADIQIPTSTVNPGQLQTRVVTGLAANTTYFFRIWTRDSFPTNWSNISNGTTRATLANPPNNFTVGAAYISSVTLSWGNNGNPNWTRYGLSKSTDNFTTTITTFVAFSNNLTAQTTTAISLLSETTHWFRVWAYNEEGLQTTFIITSTKTLDGTAPSAITNLTALTGTYPGEIDLSWSAPGDDGNSGTLQSGSWFYISTTTLFSQATTQSYWDGKRDNAEIQISTSDINPGFLCNYKLTGLLENVTYYVRIWTRDELGNWSSLSNGATNWAQISILSIDIDTTTFDFGGLPVSTVIVSGSTITIINTGNTNATYSLRITTTPAWNVDTSTPGNDIFALQGIFNDVKPSTTVFSGELHGLTTTYQLSGTAGGKFAGNQTGQNVPPADERKVWYLLKTPLSTSTTGQQNMIFYINANAP